MKRVFLSYSRRNKNFAERLARDLSDAGLDVWVDWRQIQGGEIWQQEIFNGIERSDFLIVALSPPAVQSEWVQREVNMARQQGKIIVPVMAVDAFRELQSTDALKWLLDVQFVNFDGRYEEAFPELLEALPGSRSIGAFDVVDVKAIPNPFKGLEAFQQTDAHFFFGREELIRKSLQRLQSESNSRFIAVVGASGSGKSSLVRAGVIPKIRNGALPDSDQWRIVIFTPGATPIAALAQRLDPLLPNLVQSQISNSLLTSEANLHHLSEQVLNNESESIRLLLVVDQFEELFTNAGAVERETFLNLMYHAVSVEGGRTQILITMRADFFGQLSHYPDLADLFEQENMVIVTEMTPANILKAIEGPAKAVGLVYDDGLPQRILDDVRKQPGSLPLLQYALKELFERRDGRKLTNNAYNAIGGVQRALAQHAEDIYSSLDPMQQALMRRVLLRLVEISEAGEITRRRVAQDDLRFRDVPDEQVKQIIDLMTAPESRLLIASRQIQVASEDSDADEPKVWVEVGHEALFREWERFKGWVSENLENLRLSSELSQTARDWQQSGKDSAYLLRGNRLARSEGWLQAADSTALQREFIEASIEENERRLTQEQERVRRELALQKRAANRLRNFVIVLVISLIVAIVLSLVTLNSSEQARRNEERANNALVTATIAQGIAEINAQQVLSLALAASADRLLNDNDTDLALALALSANEIDNPPPQSQRALAEIAYSPATRFIFSEHDNAVNDIAFSPDERHVVSVDDRTIIYWDVLTREVLWRIDESDELGHTQTIASIAFSSDGTRIASGGRDGLVIIWDAETGTEIRRLTEHTSLVSAVVFHPLEKMQVFSGDGNGNIILWDYENDVVRRRFTDHEAGITSIALNGNATFMISADLAGMVHVWSTRSGSFCQIPSNNLVNTVAFNPRQSMLALGTNNGIVSFWNPRNCSFIDQYTEHSDLPVNTIAFTPNGQIIASGADDNTIVLFDIAETDVINVFTGQEGEIRALDYNSNGTQLLSASGDGTIRLWDTVRTELLQTFVGHSANPRLSDVVARFSPDEQYILSASADNSLRLWDTDLGLYIQDYDGHTEAVNDVIFNIDGTLALSASSDDSVILWDVATGEIRQQLTGHTDDVTRVLFLPGESQAISAGVDGVLIVWDLATGTALQRLGINEDNGVGHTKTINDLVINLDETLLASGSGDETVIIWDLATFEVVQTFSDQKSAVESIDFDPDGSHVLSGGSNGSLILWRLNDASIIRQFDGHNASVFDIDFATNGSQVVTGGRDDTLRVWDVETGFETRRYDTFVAVLSVDFSDDGETVLTGMDDGTLRLWRVLTDLDDLISWTLLNRYIGIPTCEQREFFRLELCDQDGNQPESSPIIVPTPTPIPENLIGLEIGDTAIVNVDSVLQVREAPGTNFTLVASLVDGDVVELLDGPIRNGSYVWWMVRSADGSEGWTVQSVPDEGIQTLLPTP